MSEVCSRCGQTCAPDVYLQNKKGEKLPLCENCADKFSESAEDWPPRNGESETK